MRTQNSTKKGKITNVRLEKIVDVRTLNTPSHEDDKHTWNAYEPYGESDLAESQYKSAVKKRISKVNRERMKRVLTRKVDWLSVSEMA